MAQKKVWVTWMAANDGPYKPHQALEPLQKNGLQTAGGMWVDDLKKLVWVELGIALQDGAQTDLWVIACDRKGWETPSNRYALSLLSVMARDGRNASFPVMVLGLDFTPDAETLPTLLRSVSCLSLSDPGWPAKVVAMAFGKQMMALPDYRFEVRAHPYLGQWFEIGPREGKWAGAMFGVTGSGEITHHAVGPEGEIPERTVLEYPSAGIKARIGDTEFTIWSAQNELSPEVSYYVRIDGAPDKIIFGDHPGTDQAEVSVVDLT